MLLKRLLIVLFIIAVPPLLIWVYLPGWTHYNELRKEDERLKKELSDLKDKNKELERQEHLLKNDLRYLELVLRKELNVVRPDETVIKVVPDEELSPSSTPQTALSTETTEALATSKIVTKTSTTNKLRRT